MARRQQKSRKIIKYRRPININIGMVIFFFIFIYMVFSIYTYLTKNKIQVYEVIQGSMVEDKAYTGLILRDEVIKYTDRAGAINYYIQEGKKVAVNNTVYAIDETGKMAEFLSTGEDGTTSLSDKNLDDIRKQLSSISHIYSNMTFQKIYGAQYHLDSLVLESVTSNALANLDELLALQGIAFQQVKADESGIVIYSTDGMEAIDLAGITEASFDKSTYNKVPIDRGGNMIAPESAAYKLIRSDKWSILIPLTPEDAERYRESTSQLIHFTEHDLTTTAGFSMITGADGKTYGKLDFNKYMIQFATDRYVDIEITTKQQDGFKIPISAIVSKSFQVIPVEYGMDASDSNKYGFLKKTIGENGESSVEFVPVTLYLITDEFYYIDSDKLPSGAVLVKPDSTEEYQIGETAALEGVYNINKGFTVFKQIERLTGNDEYVIVKKNMAYGLTIYDHIALDGAKVKEDELVY